MITLCRPRKFAVRPFLGRAIGVILRRTVNPDRSLFDYGLDSLGTLQLLIALEADTGVRLRSINVTTVRALADTLCGAMQQLQSAGADTRD